MGGGSIGWGGEYRRSNVRTSMITQLFPPLKPLFGKSLKISSAFPQTQSILPPAPSSNPLMIAFLLAASILSLWISTPATRWNSPLNVIAKSPEPQYVSTRCVGLGKGEEMGTDSLEDGGGVRGYGDVRGRGEFGGGRVEGKIRGWNGVAEEYSRATVI
jgi:hypothetical protein